jgi:hypothetical protein
MVIGEETEIRCEECGEFKREMFGEISCLNDRCPSFRRIKKAIDELFGGKNEDEDKY